MFYFDSVLKNYEDKFDWDLALIHLENLYKDESIELLTTLIGFSWYYLAEGPVESKLYSKDDDVYPMKIWKKYVDLVINKKIENQYLCYILGYTLSLHGEYLGNDYLMYGKKYIRLAEEICTDYRLKSLIDAFIEMEQQKKYKPIYVSEELLKSLFDKDSLLDKYFIELYSK